MTKRAIFGQALSWKRRRFKCKGTFFSCRTRFPKCRQAYRKRFGTVAVMGRRQLCQAKGYVNEQSVSDNRIVTANATGYPKAVMSFVDKYYSPHRHSPKSYQIPTKFLPKSYQSRSKFVSLETNKIRIWNDFASNKYWDILLLPVSRVLPVYSFVFLLSRHESVFRVMQTGIWIPLFLPGKPIFAVSSGGFVQASCWKEL